MDIKVETFAKHPQWSAVKSVIEALAAQGHTAYLAGGCVRDALLGRVPKDFDVATSALPDVVEKIFPNTVAVGKAFGVILVVQDGVPIEVATFRKDGPYRDGRRPEEVEFRSAKEDAERRDFTANALFYDVLQEKIVDYVGGIEDIRNMTLRTVGVARERFEEDKLRVLRGVRFASVLSFKIEQKTWLAMKEFASQITAVSRERITDELKKMCEAGDPVTGFSMFRQCGLTEAIFPGFQVLDGEPWQQTLRGLIYLGQQPGLKRVLAWLLLAEAEFSNDRKGSIEKIIQWTKNQRFSRDLESSLKFVVERAPALRRFDTNALMVLADGDGPLLLEMLQVLNYSRKEASEELGEFVERYLEIADDQGQLPQNFLSGEDLLEAGIQQGPKFGEILRNAHRLQLERKIESRAQALEWLKNQPKV